MKTLLTLSIAGLLICFYDTEAQRRFPRNDYAPLTLGSELQPFFSNHCVSCSLFKPADINRYSDRDFIPLDVTTALSPNSLLTKKVDTCRADLIRIFSHFSTKAESKIQGFYLINNPVYNHLKDKISTPDMGDYTLYTKNCQGYFYGAVELGVEFSVATGKASYSADRNFTSIVAVNHGTFINPIQNLLTVEDPGTLFSLWKFYGDVNQSRFLKEAAYYLEQFEGVLVSNQIDATKNKDFDLKAKAEGGAEAKIASVKVKGDLELSHSVEEILHAKQTRALIFKESLKYNPLPSLKDIAVTIALVVKPQFKPEDRYYSLDKGEFIHKVVVKGLPIDMTTGYWDVVELDDSGNEMTDVKKTFYSGQASVSGKVDLKDNSIELTITGSVNRERFKDPEFLPLTIPLTYKLRSVKEVGGQKLALYPVKQPVTTSTHPRVDINQTISHIFQSKGSGTGVQSWLMNFSVLDDAQVINKRNGLRIKSIKIYKGDKQISVSYNPDPLPIPEGSSNMQLSMSGDALVNDDKKVEDDGYTVDMTAEFSTTDGRTITRTSNQKIKVYRDKDAVSPKTEYSFIKFTHVQPKPFGNWKFQLVVQKGDNEFDPKYAPLLVGLTLQDKLSKQRLGRLESQAAMKEDSQDYYSFLIDGTDTLRAGHKTATRQAILSGTLVVMFDARTSESIPFEIPVTIQVPYCPKVSFMPLEKQGKGKVIWKGQFNIDDPLAIAGQSARLDIKGKAKVGNKEYPVKSKLKKLDGTHYEYEVEFTDANLKPNWKESSKYDLDLQLTIDNNSEQLLDESISLTAPGPRI